MASRVSSQLPKGTSRTAMYNIEACNALIRALPSNSANLTSSVFNTLSVKLQRNPSFVQLSKALVKYADSINTDISANGIVLHKFSNNNSRNNDSRNNFYRMNRNQKIMSINGNNHGNTKNFQGKRIYRNQRMNVNAIAYSNTNNSNINTGSYSNYNKRSPYREPVYNMYQGHNKQRQFSNNRYNYNNSKFKAS